MEKKSFTFNRTEVYMTKGYTTEEDEDGGKNDVLCRYQ